MNRWSGNMGALIVGSDFSKDYGNAGGLQNVLNCLSCAFSFMVRRVFCFLMNFCFTPSRRILFTSACRNALFIVLLLLSLSLFLLTTVIVFSIPSY